MRPSSYWERLASRRLSRRRALKAGVAAGLGAAGLSLAACGEGEEGQPARTETPTVDLTPQPGGRTRLGINADPGSLDPNLSAVSGFLSCRIHNPLHAINMDTQELMPLVAESLEQPDETTFIWKLRSGVRFQNVEPTYGREVNAEDVVYSFDRLKAVPTLNDRKLLTRYAEGYEAVDDHTFRLRTNRIYSPTLDQTGNFAYSVVPREAVEKWEDLSTQAAGCGAWILDDYVRGERVRLRKNPDYYQAGRPFPDEEEWLIIPDTGSLWQTFRTGRLDYCNVNVDKFKRDEVKNDRSITVVESPSLYTINCYIRVDRPPLSDVRVREALDIAIDRDDYITKLYFGEGKYNGPIPWPLEYWALPQDELRSTLKYEPERAKALLSAAGHGDGFDLQTPVPNIGDCPQIATIVADHYSKVGVNLKIEPKDLAVYLSQYLYSSQFHITFSFANLPYMDPDMPLRSYYSQGQNGDRNPGMSNDPEVDALIEGLWLIFDREERRKAVLDVQRVLLKKHGPLYPLCSPEGYVGYSSRVQGIEEGSGLVGWLGTSYWLQQS
jgi:peptide/nickel transport system substrate-binding protein